MVHGQRRDNKWHPYTNRMDSAMIFHDTPDATGVGVPFIIPPLLHVLFAAFADPHSEPGLARCEWSASILS
jgi:hypothetical protein